MDNEIATAAEAEEAQALPRLHEVHTEAGRGGGPCESDLPPVMRDPAAGKSPARWAYERLILYIKTFEERLDNAHEVAMGFAGGDAGVIRIEGLGYFDPDIVTFHGTEANGARTQLIQHVTQLNVMLRAMPKPKEEAPARRIGFRLARDLARDEAESGPAAEGSGD